MIDTQAINKPLLLTPHAQQHLSSYLGKCDRRLLLYLCLGYALDSLNKMALPNAKISGLTEDLALTGYDINVALGAYYLGSFLFQLPANMIMKLSRPTYWLSGSMVGWSLVTIGTGLARNGGQLVWLRFAFGAVQAGYLTGCLYYISYWYPREQVRQRMGFFFASAGAGGIVSGPLCSLLTYLTDGSWRAIFVVVGMLSLGWGLVGPWVLEDFPDKAAFITGEERQVIAEIMERQNTLVSDKHISVRQIMLAIRDPKIWMWTVIDFCANAATQVNGLFGPTILASLGFTTAQALAMSAITNFMSFSGMASIAYIARYLQASSRAIALSNLLTISGFMLALWSDSVWTRLLALLVFSYASPQPAAHSPAWELANQQGSTKPAVAATLTSAFGGLGPILTAMVFRDSDSPQFTLGLSVCLALTVVCLGTAMALKYLLVRENQRRDKNSRDLSELTYAEVLDLADNHPDFRYKI